MKIFLLILKSPVNILGLNAYALDQTGPFAW